MAQIFHSDKVRALLPEDPNLAAIWLHRLGTHLTHVAGPLASQASGTPGALAGLERKHEDE